MNLYPKYLCVLAVKLETKGESDDDEFPAEPGLLMTGRKNPFTMQEALNILKTTNHSKCCSYMPDKPKGEM